MAASLTLLHWIELLGVGIAALIGAYAWRDRSESGAFPLVVISVGIACWLLGEVAVDVISTPSIPVGSMVLFAGVGMTAAGWAAFALEFSGTRDAVGRRLWALLAVHPVAVVAAIATNPLHGAFFLFDPVTGEYLGFGVLYWVHAAYAYVVTIAGFLLVASMLWRRQTLYPGQVYVVLVGSVLPMLADTVSMTVDGAPPLHGPALIATCLCLGVGLFRHKLMRLAPAAQGTLLENLRDGVFVLDGDGRFADVNPTARDVLGRDDLVGVDAATYLAAHDAFAPHAERIVDATEETTFEVAVDDRHYDVRVTPLFDHRDELVGRQVQLHEVTEQRRRERELERQNERLDRFASVLSHDLRNPLNVATGRTELVQETGDVRHVEDVEQALDRIESIIDEMLTLTREGEAVESVEPLSLETVANAAWETVDTGDAALSVETGRRIEADRDRTTRLFENLFRNSVEHAGPDVTVTVGDHDDGFYVADDGPGIPPEDRERVLEYGYTSETEGTGLGLSIVTSIANAHGWTVSVTESERGGARFEFGNVGVVSAPAVSESSGDRRQRG